MEFTWTLINTEHLEDSKLEEIEEAFDAAVCLYACACRIEEEFDANNPAASIGDCVNVDQDAIDEAYVVLVNVEDDEVEFVLDLDAVRYQ